jgi:N,N'-diacetyllegionaminate synthase
MKKLDEYGFNTINPFYIIAEIGINHGGDEDLAKKLIDSAVKAGADSVKFQTYITEKRVGIDSPIYDVLKKCELSFEAFERLNKHAQAQGIDFFSTPFDAASVQCLEEIGVGLYKIASFDVVNHKLLEEIAATEKTMIMSVGMASSDEITKAYNILKEKTEKIAILHCISAYPTMEADANLGVIKSLIDNYDCVIGQSDHTNDIQVPLYAAAMGAQVLEKHFKIDEDMDCVDSVVSITESQMGTLVDEVKRITKIMGDSHICLSSAEKDTVQYRRKTITGE